jgi:roadblock/LC7 domain-containing protein
MGKQNIYSEGLIMAKPKRMIEGKTIDELMQITGLARATIYANIKRGQTYEQIVSSQKSPDRTALMIDIMEKTGLTEAGAYGRIRRKEKYPNIDLYAPVTQKQVREVESERLTFTQQQIDNLITEFADHPLIKKCISQRAKLVTAIALKTGGKYTTISHRLNAGWSYERMLGIEVDTSKQPTIMEQIKASPFYDAAIKMTPQARLFCGLNVKLINREVLCQQ